MYIYGMLKPTNKRIEEIEEISDIVHNAFEEADALDELEKLCNLVPSEPNIVEGTVNLSPDIPPKN